MALISVVWSTTKGDTFNMVINDWKHKSYRKSCSNYTDAFADKIRDSYLGKNASITAKRIKMVIYI